MTPLSTDSDEALRNENERLKRRIEEMQDALRRMTSLAKADHLRGGLRYSSTCRVCQEIHDAAQLLKDK